MAAELTARSQQSTARKNTPLAIRFVASTPILLSRTRKRDADCVPNAQDPENSSFGFFLTIARSCKDYLFAALEQINIQVSIVAGGRFPFNQAKPRRIQLAIPVEWKAARPATFWAAKFN